MVLNLFRCIRLYTIEVVHMGLCCCYPKARDASTQTSASQLQSNDSYQASLKDMLKLNSRNLSHITDTLIKVEPTAKDTTTLAISDVIPEQLHREYWSIKQFRILHTIHHGYNSKVYEAMCTHSATRVAIKDFNLSNMVEKERLHLFREITIHSKLHHRNIVDFYVAFKENNHVYICMEFIQGKTVRAYLRKNDGKLHPSKAIVLLKHMIAAMVHLHQQNILHRDIKPDNIMIEDGTHSIKLVDFGLAINLDKEVAHTRAGTLYYMAPETFMCRSILDTDDSNKEQSPKKAKVTYDLKVDSWALGIFAYELVVGITPFHSEYEDQVVRQLAKYRIHIPSYVGPVLSNFIAKALIWNPNERPSIRDLADLIDDKIHIVL